MSTGRLLVLGVVLQAAMLVLAIAANVWVTYHLVQQRQDVWCPLLADLTARPLPATATAAERHTFGELVDVKRAWC